MGEMEEDDVKHAKEVQSHTDDALNDLKFREAMKLYSKEV